jgi:hypothetical protein
MNLFKNSVSYYRTVIAKFERWSNWEQLKELSSTKLFASSTIFLFIVPVVAKFLVETPDIIKLHNFDQIIPLHIKLPFS